MAYRRNAVFISAKGRLHFAEEATAYRRNAVGLSLHRIIGVVAGLVPAIKNVRHYFQRVYQNWRSPEVQKFSHYYNDTLLSDAYAFD